MSDGDYTLNTGFTGGFTYGPQPGSSANAGGAQQGDQSSGQAAQTGQGTSVPPPVQPVTPQPAGVQPVPVQPSYPASQAPASAAQAPQYGAPNDAQAFGGAPIPPPPAGAAPMSGMMGDQGQAAEPPGDPNYVFAAKMKDFTTTITLPAHSLKFDENRFINLLAGSISLSKDEKKKIIESISKLRQEQVDELIRIFDEERAKFIELSSKHSAQLKKLEAEHHADWRDLEMEVKAATQKEEESAKAEEIRKQLGL